MRSFAPRGGGGIGRRAWLRAMWALRPWGFESPPPHQRTHDVQEKNELLRRLVFFIPSLPRTLEFPDEKQAPTGR